MCLLTACLLFNEPASYSSAALVKGLRPGAVGKPSVNSAIWLQAVDTKPGDLAMTRLKRG